MFNIKSVEDEKELAKLREFMLKQYQYYTQYGLWVNEKCISRIESGEYQNLIVLASGEVVADAISRQLTPEKTEVKNFRIDPRYRRRDLGHFLMAQVQHLNPGKKLVLDVTVDNFEGVGFFIRDGFNIVGKQQLYKEGQDEYLLEKLPRQIVI